MEKLYGAKEEPANLNIQELVKIHFDSLVFLGSANINLNQKRIELLNTDFPPKSMQRLCRDDVEFTGTE